MIWLAASEDGGSCDSAGSAWMSAARVARCAGVRSAWARVERLRASARIRRASMGSVSGRGGNGSVQVRQGGVQAVEHRIEVGRLEIAACGLGGGGGAFQGVGGGHVRAPGGWPPDR